MTFGCCLVTTTNVMRRSHLTSFAEKLMKRAWWKMHAKSSEWGKWGKMFYMQSKRSQYCQAATQGWTSTRSWWVQSKKKHQASRFWVIFEICDKFDLLICSTKTELKLWPFFIIIIISTASCLTCWSHLPLWCNHPCYTVWNRIGTEGAVSVSCVKLLEVT